MRKIESENNNVEFKSNEVNKSAEVKVSDTINERKYSELQSDEFVNKEVQSKNSDIKKNSNEHLEKSEKMFDDLDKCYEKVQEADFNKSLQENSNDFKENFVSSVSETLNNNKEGISNLKNNIKEQILTNGLNEKQLKNNPWFFVVVEHDLGKTNSLNSFTNRLGDFYASKKVEQNYLGVHTNSQNLKEQSFLDLTPNQKEIMKTYANNLIDRAKLSNKYIMDNYPTEENSLSRFRADSIIKLNNKIIEQWSFVNDVNKRGVR